jgi:hypothetical protein
MPAETWRAGHVIDLRGHCARCLLRWPCDWSVLCDELGMAEERIAMLEALVREMGRAVKMAKDHQTMTLQQWHDAYGDKDASATYAFRYKTYTALLNNPLAQEVLGDA